MVSDWFAAWSARHMRRFSLDDGESVAEWKSEFEGIGVSEGEAEEASRYLLANAPPAYKSKHLAALLAQIKAARQKNGQTQSRQYTECEICFGTGMVPVPWPPSEPWDGKYTNAVYCSCGLGPWYQAEHLKKIRKVPMMLRDYEDRFPNWREYIDRRREILEGRSQ